jgi:hypothetical protein
VAGQAPHDTAGSPKVSGGQAQMVRFVLPLVTVTARVPQAVQAGVAREGFQKLVPGGEGWGWGWGLENEGGGGGDSGAGLWLLGHKMVL